MAGRQQTPPPRTRDHEVRAWAEACQGTTHAAIAAELGVTQSAVTKMIARVSARTLKTLHLVVEQQKALQDGRLEHVYTEAMGAWRRSQEPRKKSRHKKHTQALTTAPPLAATDDRPISAVVREELLNEATSSAGASAFLMTSIAALEAKAKLWGLHAPKKLDILDKRRPLEQLSDEELQRRASENAALLASEGAGE